MTCGIYAIRNTVNGKIYIGSAIDIQARWRLHKHQLRSGKHHSYHLQRAWNKYGEATFDFIFLHKCPPIECVVIEQVFINHYKTCNRTFGYNISPVAGSSLGVKLTEEQNKRNALAQTGRKITEETRRKLSELRKGKKKSVEWRINQSESQKGRVFSIEHRAKLSAAAKERQKRAHQCQ